MTRSISRLTGLVLSSPLLLSVLLPSAASAEEDVSSEGVRIDVVIEPLETGGGTLTPTGLEPSAGIVAAGLVLLVSGLTLLAARRRSRIRLRSNP